MMDEVTYPRASEDEVPEPDVWVSSTVPLDIARDIWRSKHDG